MQPVIAAPHPALVTREAAQRLPRLALWLFCAAYVLPGLFGRDPWRGADITAFGQMLALAEGRTSWLSPALGGVPTGDWLLPNWIGALAIRLSHGWLDPAVAARVPFAVMLALTLVALWYATYHLALKPQAQPVQFAFGGEADPVDYARAVADGAVLAMIATLGLLQLGHETTPELPQLAALTTTLWAVAALPRRLLKAGPALLIALPTLAASGAPVIALAVGAGALMLQLADRECRRPGVAGWTVAAMLLAALIAWPTHTWAWRLHQVDGVMDLAEQWVWFLWPSWLLAGWAVWRWRQHLRSWHMAWPAWVFVVCGVASVAMGGSNRALMLGVPALAVLAAFALPTLARSTSAAVDWFTVFAFTGCAIVVWVMYAAMQTGWPTKPAANVLRLAPGFVARVEPLELVAAIAGTLAWVWLVRWRTRRHRAALWKSLVLPAGGVALMWLLLMTLWLPLLDYARSNRPLALMVQAKVPPGDCVLAPGASPNLIVALEWHARMRVLARGGADLAAQPVQVPRAEFALCGALLLVRESDDLAATAAQHQALLDAGWTETARLRRPTDRRELTVVYRYLRPR